MKFFFIKMSGKEGRPFPTYEMRSQRQDESITTYCGTLVFSQEEFTLFQATMLAGQMQWQDHELTVEFIDNTSQPAFTEGTNG